MKEQGCDISKMTPEELKEKLSAEQMKRLISSYGNLMKTNAPLLYTQYTKAPDDKTRRLWLHRFMLDQSQGKNTAATTVTVNHGTKNESTEIWITQVQMAGPLYAGSPEHAEIWSGVLPSRPHCEEVFRDKGIVEYKWSASVVKRTDGKDEKTTVKSKADLNEDEVKQVTDAMRSAALPGVDASSSSLATAEDPSGQHKRAKKTQEQKDQEKAEKDRKKEEEAKANPAMAEFMATKTLLQAEIKDTKQWAKTLNTELADVPSLGDKLMRKGFPKEAKVFLMKKHEEVKRSLDGVIVNSYTPIKCFFEQLTFGTSTVDEVKQKTQELAAATKVVQEWALSEN